MGRSNRDKRAARRSSTSDRGGSVATRTTPRKDKGTKKRKANDKIDDKVCCLFHCLPLKPISLRVANTSDKILTIGQTTKTNRPTREDPSYNPNPSREENLDRI